MGMGPDGQAISVLVLLQRAPIDDPCAQFGRVASRVSSEGTLLVHALSLLDGQTP